MLTINICFENADYIFFICSFPVGKASIEKSSVISVKTTRLRVERVQIRYFLIPSTFNRSGENNSVLSCKGSRKKNKVLLLMAGPLRGGGRGKGRVIKEKRTFL